MHHKEMIVVGGGHSGIAMALGAAKLGLKVLLIEKEDLLSAHCSLAQSIKKDSFLRFSRSFENVNSIMNSSLQQGEVKSLFDKVNLSWRKYPRAQIISLINDLGVEVWLGEAKILSKNIITVGGRVVTSNRVVWATGIEEQTPSILGIESVNYRTVSNFFDTPISGNSICIVGGTIDSLELAQGLSHIGLDVTLAVLPNQTNWEKKALGKVEKYLIADGVAIHKINKIKEVYLHSKRNIIVCEDSYDDNYTLDGHELVFAMSPIPQSSMNIASQGLMITSDGVWVNSVSQTSTKDIYAVGSMTSARNPYMNSEEQITTALHNMLLKKPSRKVDLKYNIKMINTSPGYVEVGRLTGKGIKEAAVKLSNYNRPYLPDRNTLEVDLVLKKDFIIGFKAFGYEVPEVASNLMHTLDSDSNIWSFARLPYLPGTMSHSLKRIIENMQPGSFFPKYIGGIARFSDKILGGATQAKTYLDKKIRVYKHSFDK